MSRGHYYIGVDLGGTNMVAALVDAQGRIKARAKVPTLAKEGPASVLRRMSAEILELVRSSKIPRKQIKAVGVGSPGPLNAHTGHVLKTPNLPGWNRVHVTRIVGQKTHFKVFLQNDANCAALGEAAYGAGKGFKNVIVLTLGTGVGGGIILNGELYDGPDSTAGELGHYSLNPWGPLCGCGQKGCLEQYASATAMARRGRELAGKAQKGALWTLCGGDVSKISSKMIHQALQVDDPVAVKVWEEASTALGSAVAGYLNIFNPDRVILFGGVMLGGRELLDATRHIALAGSFPQPAKRVRIVAAKLGDDAGVIGAAEVAKRAMLPSHA